MEAALVRPNPSSVRHDLSRYCNMFPDNDTKDEVDNKVNLSSPCDPCSLKQSARGISEVSKQSPDRTLSPGTTAHSSAAVTPSEKSSSSPVTNTFPCSLPSVGQLTGEKPEQYQEDIRLRQHQQTPQQHPQRLNHIDIQIDVSRHESDSDSSSTIGRVDGLNRCREFKPETEKDEAYWEKRRKNNEAARKSREKRRINDIMLAGRINVLEENNSRLRCELGALKNKFGRQDGREYGNSMPKESAISGVIDKMSSKCLNKNKLSCSESYMGTLGKSSTHLPYSSPPPLLAVADAMSLYSSGCNQGFPYILPDGTSMNQDGCLETVPFPFLTGMQHFHELRPHHVTSFKDPTKSELMDEGKVLTRGRSNNNIDCASAFHIESPQAALFRRGSVGNCSQYRHPLNASSSDISHHPYFNCNIFQASHFYHLQQAYDNHQLLQNSPIPDIHSNISYDEPLQLTIRRDCFVNSKSNSSSADDNSRDSASNALLTEKSAAPANSPVPSFPLKPRHKIPARDMAYPGGIFPTTIPPIPAGLSPPSYSNSCFLKGLVNLSDADLFQTNPASLVPAELAAPYAIGKDGTLSSRGTSLETKYFDPKYLERRRRNNEAARKCRENRKSLIQTKEAKSSYLETENSKLRVEVTGLQEEMKQLRELIEKRSLQEDIKGDSKCIES